MLHPMGLPARAGRGLVHLNRAHGRVFKPLGRLGPAAAERLLEKAIHRHETAR
jgi:hypothetical protein